MFTQFTMSTFYLTLPFSKSILLSNCWMSSKQCRSWSDAAFCDLLSRSALFAQAWLFVKYGDLIKSPPPLRNHSGSAPAGEELSIRILKVNAVFNLNPGTHERRVYEVHEYWEDEGRLKSYTTPVILNLRKDSTVIENWYYLVQPCKRHKEEMTLTRSHKKCIIFIYLTNSTSVGIRPVVIVISNRDYM